MIATALRRGVLLGVLVMATACGDATPTSPTAAVAPPPVLAPGQPPPRTFPPLTGPSRTFVFDRELTYRVNDYTKSSRFVLYDTGGFALQYSPPIGEYRGGYAEADGTITFDWEGWSVAGPWGATGTLKDGTLTVRYNLIMQLTDFDDAVYRLAPSSP
jgi:hypothetical protein